MRQWQDDVFNEPLGEQILLDWHRFVCGLFVQHNDDHLSLSQLLTKPSIGGKHYRSGIIVFACHRFWYAVSSQLLIHIIIRFIHMK